MSRHRTKGAQAPLTTYLPESITKIVDGHPNSRLDELLPWAYPMLPALRDVA